MAVVVVVVVVVVVGFVDVTSPNRLIPNHLATRGQFSFSQDCPYLEHST